MNLCSIEQGSSRKKRSHTSRRNDKTTTTSLHIDYSVLSVAIMTLGLILVVEILRHKIDHAAKGRPLAKAVLDNVYLECTCIRVFVGLR